MSKLNDISNNKKIAGLKIPQIKQVIRKNFDLDKVEKMSQERILQKNVVYVIGLTNKLAQKEILQNHKYFGQYGNIVKILTNKPKTFVKSSLASNDNCNSSYIYYSKPQEAAMAILAVDNFKIDNTFLKTSFGRTKYCSNYLKGVDCINKDCFYLHKLADKDEIINVDDSRYLFQEHHIQAIKISNLLDEINKKKIISEENKLKGDFVLPRISTIYNKPFIIEYINNLNKTVEINDSINNNNNYNGKLFF
jgi:CCR4-NOT transcription complex subunit 4